MPNPPPTTPAPSFTGRARRRKTRFAVRAADRISHALITFGGLGTIVAVSLVCVYLIYVAAPLFFPTTIAPEGKVAAAQLWSPEPPSHLATDEHQALGWAWFGAEGVIRLFRLDTGELLEERRLVEGDPPTAASINPRSGEAVFGFADGSIRLGSIAFSSDFLDSDEADDELRALEIGRMITRGAGVVTKTAEGQFRRHKLVVSLEEPVELAPDGRVLLIDHSIRPSGPTIAAVTDDGVLHIREIRSRRNLMTHQVTHTLTGGRMTLPDGPPPRRLLLSGIGDTAYLVWSDGRLVRLDARSVERPVFAEEVDLVETPGATLTALEFMIGKTTLIVGDSHGGLSAWFRIRSDRSGAPDGSALVRAHELPGADAPVTSLAASARTRLLAAGYGDGRVRLLHVTSGALLAQGGRDGDGPVAALALGPKDDAIVSATGYDLRRWSIDEGHPEATLASIFTPIWYEGYPRAQHVWQSSSGTDDFEPKMGLVPLIFGTIKATIYSMIFGAPLALLAAIYTSEFLKPGAKARIKPTIEMMASLPSVVLGFLAALVFAPFIERVVPETLLSFVAVPFAVLLGAYLWQLLPGHVSVRRANLRFPMMLLALPLGVALAFALGRPVERWLFAGDIFAWLDGQRGGALGGWVIMLFPLAALAIAVAMSRVVNPFLRRRTRDWSEPVIAWIDLAKFLSAVAATIALAVGLGAALGGAGLDLRGSLVDTYVQRNALVVGFVMGFAIIPIIYTIADDAMSSVPEHLRAASLGAGATPWQTAVRIIIPTAMSGLFSAVMIGFGRAVGETMIVLMAAGNTPVMEWNIFNGFRTLSANIAVELPEAVQNGTHFRMLFLAALTLFAMTFVINTVAEVVRQKFRRRAYTL